MIQGSSGKREWVSFYDLGSDDVVNAAQSIIIVKTELLEYGRRLDSSFSIFCWSNWLEGESITQPLAKGNSMGVKLTNY